MTVQLTNTDGWLSEASDLAFADHCAHLKIVFNYLLKLLIASIPTKSFSNFKRSDHHCTLSLNYTEVARHNSYHIRSQMQQCVTYTNP